MTIQEIVMTKVASAEVDVNHVKMAIAEVEQAIMNYCNRSDVPEELKFTVANMAADLVEYELQKRAGSGGSINPDNISSLRIGDTLIDLKASGGGKSHLQDLDDIVMNYRGQLNAFRKMVW